MVKWQRWISGVQNINGTTQDCECMCMREGTTSLVMVFRHERPFRPSCCMSLFFFKTMLPVPTCMLHELMSIFQLIPLCTWSWDAFRLKERSLHLAWPVRSTELHAQRERSTRKKKGTMRREAVILWKGPLGGPFLFPSPKKQEGRGAARKPHGYYEFCKNGCLRMDFDAYRGRSWFCSYFGLLSPVRTMSATAELGFQPPKKKRGWNATWSAGK